MRPAQTVVRIVLIGDGVVLVEGPEREGHGRQHGEGDGHNGHVFCFRRIRARSLSATRRGITPDVTGR